MIVLDTNVLSELMKPAPAAKVVKWMAVQPATILYTTSITQAEILHGLMLLPRRWIRIDEVITREIRSYVSRDWAAARASKDAFWAARIAQLGPIEGLRIADELRRQVVRQNPGWPTDEERHDDLATHTRLSELLRRASRPRSR